MSGSNAPKTEANAAKKPTSFFGYVALMLCVAMGVKLVMDFLPDSIVETLFMRPAAHLAVIYWGVPLETAPLAFTARGVTLNITRACAATDFFSLVFALLAFATPFWKRMIPQRRINRPLCVIAALPMAWVVAVVTNAIRLAMLIVTDGMFPAAQIPAVHLAAGVAVFLPAYAALWYFLTQNRGPTK